MTRAPENARFAGIALDMDGVIVDSDACHARAFETLWREIGLEGPPYAELAGRPTSDVVTEYTAALEPDASRIGAWVARKQTLARECLASAEILFPDARASVQALSDRYPLALVTGGSRPTVEATLERYGLRSAFRIVLTGDDVAAGKPAPEAYERAAREVAEEPRSLLVVEDSRNGIQAGLSAGAFVVSVRSGEKRRHGRFLGAFETLSDMIDAMGLVA